MEKVVLTTRNRDGAKIWLENEFGNTYSIHTTPDKNYIFEYACCNYESLPEDAALYDFVHEYNGKIIKGTYESFDPSGGPYLSVGSEIVPNHILKRIYFDKQMLFVLERKG